LSEVGAERGVERSIGHLVFWSSGRSKKSVILSFGLLVVWSEQKIGHFVFWSSGRKKNLTKKPSGQEAK
jgi:membrane-bound inhibitor of C-type lysozyme